MSPIRPMIPTGNLPAFVDPQKPWHHNACLLSKYGRRSSRDQTSMLTNCSLEAKCQNRTTCHASLCSVVVTMGEQYAVLCTLGLKCLKPLQATLSILARARVGDELPR
jgi:hypothetical protein